MHLKRQNIKKFWPVVRKGTKYLSVASHDKENSIPLVVVVREIIGLVQNKKELQNLINDKKVFINSKEVRDTNYPVLLFDSLSFPSVKKHYRAILKEKKFGFEEISEKEASTRIYKIINKKQLRGNKTQINLSDGKNILSSEKIKVGDFAIINNKDNKIVMMIPIQKGTDVVVIKGKHMGTNGKINEISEEGQNKIAKISNKDSEIKVDIRNLFITDRGLKN